MKTDTIPIEGDEWKQCHVIGELQVKPICAKLQIA